LGANAVVGVDIDYEVLGERSGMLMVSVSGTAVRVSQDPDSSPRPGRVRY
jgi:uncharacterized protein YbjQ (UPF0145 family)